ncbi:DUF4907 domain-containing protein [Flagellimonas sp. HMM57]|uniref:DUF4907 domain-containing protein n=1 Tax=unclassified Flagellimonas TaxID=2644544 RepID=UPI0013D70462|nr:MULTISPECIES: DUF4907 domain-containing protein [unclassified Flagellimonas]MBS9461936.1 DUF4907 domain-containing protein [Flagellimonas sp. 389]UII74796.1 DUF4907 domain-containing protein [Flagellimonas sp. HMM57]
MKSLTKKLIIISAVFAMGLFFLMAIDSWPKEKTQEQVLKSKVIIVDGGFGYQIYNKKKLIIEQNFIPAISGKKPFVLAKDAQLIADLVVKKLSNGESPIIYKEEMDKLNIEL